MQKIWLWVYMAICVLVGLRTADAGFSIVEKHPVMQGDWLVDGPIGGNVSALIIHPQETYILYAATEEGSLYTSQNRGNSWQALTPGIDRRGIRITCLAFYPANPDILYAGAAGIWEKGGLFRSLDRGDSWNQVRAGIGNISVHAIHYAPRNPARVYVATDDGVYTSLDGGSNWQRASEGLQHSFVKSLAVHPEKANIVYAGTWRQVYKSLDGGEHWTRIPNGMDTDTDVFDLAFDPDDPAIVYAATCNGIFRSRDAGTHWQKFAESHGLATIRTQTLIPSRHHSRTVYAGTTEGIFRSNDGGGHWQRIADASMVVAVLREDPGDPERLYAGIEGGAIMISDDQGRTWSRSAQGIINTHVRTLVTDPADPAIVYAGTLYGHSFGGVFRSHDGGVTWEQRTNGLTNTNIEILLLHPHNREILYAGTHAGLFVTSDAGRQWRQIGKKTFDEIRITSIACSTRFPDVLYVGTWDGLFRSADRGASWTRIWNPSGRTSDAISQRGELGLKIYTVALVPSEDATIYAGTDRGIYVSQDAGQTWSVLTTFFSDVPTTSIALDPEYPERLLVGTPFGAYQSDDAGFSWKKLAIGSQNFPVGTLLIDSRVSERIYVGGLRAHGVYVTQNRGVTWQRLDQQMSHAHAQMSQNHAWAIALDASHPATVYVGTSGGGVYRYVPRMYYSGFANFS